MINLKTVVKLGKTTLKVVGGLATIATGIVVTKLGIDEFQKNEPVGISEIEPDINNAQDAEIVDEEKKEQ